MMQFELPSLGSDMDQGKLLEWKVKPGDHVKRGQVIAVVDTSKAAVDIEIWHDGVIGELLVEPGTSIPVGTAMATILESGETQTPGIKAEGAIRHAVTPSARKRAKELGVDSDKVRGTGAQGSVTLADVEAAALSGKLAEPPATSTKVIIQTEASGRHAEMRKTIAAAMSRSKREIPHYYLSEMIPMDAALQLLLQHNQSVPVRQRILPVVMQIKALATVLQKMPQFNGYFRDGVFQPVLKVNAGMAISLRGGGLVAPAILDVGAKSLPQLMEELADLVKRARAGSLYSSEMSEPSITVTNLGDQGVESVFGVIYPPQVALVGFGRLTARPWAVGSELRAVSVLTATLAGDHRVSDGHQGALFLAGIRDLLQHPESLFDTSKKGNLK
jgi:pyruvate dehydrogenase E2 component (dihydrolipoamide acetyltransferase)